MIQQEQHLLVPQIREKRSLQKTQISELPNRKT
jgi:hypothetical protein